MMRFKLLSLALVFASCALAQTRQETILSEGWQFSQDQTTWQTVSVPHDWAIAGPFDKKWDLQKVAIEQNGETEATEKSGRSGALPWIGQGYYKRTLQIPADCRHAELLFDGAMAEPTVYLNGELAGYWAYGYNSFRVDLTPFMHAGDNQLEVHLQNVEESSRWYPGAGIYRPVTLITTGHHWLDPWKTFIRTRQIAPTEAVVDVSVGAGSEANEQLTFEVDILDAEGRIVAQGHNSLLDLFGYDGVEENNTVSNTAMNLYPNPAVDQLNVTLNQNADIVIYNIMGQNVMNVEGHAGTNSINISSLNAGVYFISAGNDTQKFIVK